MDSLKARYLAEHLVRWFRSSQRDLPWRKTRDPYRIWVSEIMLQQTRVETVIPYYERFVARFPTVKALAEAPEADLIKMWEGLGYYSRVRNMQIAARTIQQDFGGRMPDTPQDIRKLKGIGPYTAGAILSIAFGKPIPAVDGNVLRVMSRFFLLYDDIAKPATRTKVERMLEDIIPEDAAGDFNQALMELGALVCTPRSVKCDTCPVAFHCAAYREGVVQQLPIKTKAKKPRYEERAAYIIEGTGEREGQILLQRRPDDGLLARMWELPNEELSFEAQEQFGLSERFLMDAEHVFSHIKWQMKVYTLKDVEADEVIGKLSPQSGIASDEKSGQQDGTIAAEEKGSQQDGAIAAEEKCGHQDGAIAAEEKSSSQYGMIAADATCDQRDGAIRADENHLTVKETAVSYEPNRDLSAELAEGFTGPDIMWVSKHNWRELALPNVFIRILQQYFS